MSVTLLSGYELTDGHKVMFAFILCLQKRVRPDPDKER